MTTAYMQLDLPVPTITIGPAYASMNNDAFELIDEHDHSSGKGAKVKPNGLDINDDLDIQVNQLLNIEAAQLSELVATLSGPTNILKLHAYLGDLWFTNGNGTAVQLTSGGSIISTPGSAQTFLPQAVNSNVTILPTDDFVYLLVDTSASRTITLPFASAVTAGRIFIMKDISGTAVTNPITVNAQGSDLIDGAASFTIDINRSCFVFITDGASKWYIS